MISLNKFMLEVKNRLKRLEEKHSIKESISLKGHEYTFIQQNWGEQRNAYIHQN